MFGVYFHIPFCKSKCGYCDFYSVASQTHVQPMVEAISREIELRKNYFSQAKNIDSKSTMYFGGGTPSLLLPSQIGALAQKAAQVFEVKNISEFTVEVNPDDITTEYLQELRDVGVNRLSVGIQSFFDDDLQRVNRRHSAQQAKDCIALAQKTGFDNISIDLIYGLPHMDAKRWHENLSTAFSLDVQHISAYALTVEERTPFGVQQRKGRLILPTEAEVAEQYEQLCELSKQHGFDHYEISNFARNDFYSKHNTLYWQQKPYIGFGPSAHSYNEISRQHNHLSNSLYINKLKNNTSQEEFFTLEKIGEKERYNEYIFTGLRTKWGIDLVRVQQAFDKRFYKHLMSNAQKHINAKSLIVENEWLVIPENRWLVSDAIIVDLIWI